LGTRVVDCHGGRLLRLVLVSLFVQEMPRVECSEVTCAPWTSHKGGPRGARRGTIGLTGALRNPLLSSASLLCHPFLLHTVLQKSLPQIFLACATVDFVALIDQTTLAVALSTIGSALHSSSQTSWIASGYFMYVSSTNLPS
jgi:hypothetical protein